MAGGQKRERVCRVRELLRARMGRVRRGEDREGTGQEQGEEVWRERGRGS